MALFIAKRLLMALATVLVVAVLAFLLVHAMPGSPGAVSLGAGASPGSHRRGQPAARLERSPRGPVLPLARRRRPGQPRDLADRRPLRQRRPGQPASRHRVTGRRRHAAQRRPRHRPGRHRGRARAAWWTASSAASPAWSVALPAFWIGIIFVYLLAVQSSVFPATGYVPFEVSPQDWALSLALPVITLAVGGGGLHRPPDQGLHA